LEEEIDEAKRTDSQRINKSAHRNAMNKDENPEKSRSQPDVMQNFSQNQERAWSIAQTEPNHLHKDQDNCENVQTGHKDLDEGYQKKRDDDNSLSLHHEGSATIFFQKLTCKESHSYLEQIKVDKH
jgi:hypothetical protein